MINKKIPLMIGMVFLLVSILSISIISSSPSFAYNYLEKTYCSVTGCTIEGNLNVTEDLTFINPVSQYHREKGIDTTTTDTWENITFDTEVNSEITKGYELVDNNESIKVNFSGIVKFQGKVTMINNATGTETQKVALRIVEDGNENRCTQVSSNTQRDKKVYNTIPITGTSKVKEGSIINLQYKVNDVDLDMYGDPVFDDPVAISLNLEKISS